jgi:MoaA/NifB/PqqE/SkfB family radical SAM enzyme
VSAALTADQERVPEDRVVLANGYVADGHYPAAMVNITNRCNLECQHCFVFQDGNPNTALSPRRELSTEVMLEVLEALRDRHGITYMLWMGGEPLLRPELLRRGVELFERSHVTTNGTLPLIDLGPDVLYVVSLDGPEPVNDAIRGAGSFARVLRRLAGIPTDFSSAVQVQCTVTPSNQAHLAELVETLVDTRVEWMTFSFVVPYEGADPALAWPDLESRLAAVDEVRALKERFGGFVRNRSLALDLMAPDRAPAITAACPARAFLLPLWLDGDRFTTPFCCYGNGPDCARCGAWVVFDIAARIEAVKMADSMRDPIEGPMTGLQTMPEPAS